MNRGRYRKRSVLVSRGGRVYGSAVRLSTGAWTLVKEVARHVLRRPVIGVAVVGRDAGGRFLLVRRADTGTWALPGGTLEWGERIGPCIVRELQEEAAATVESEPKLAGVYSDPGRDPRFHAVTIVVECRVASESPAAENPLEILEARFFAEADLPANMAFGMKDMLDRSRASPEVQTAYLE
jgi:8-oxo-dGTP diphosphatase